MNIRERFIAALTFGTPDKYPLEPGGPRESTLKAWREQGLPPDRYYMDVVLEHLGITPDRPKTPQTHTGLVTKMIPEFEEKVLKHENGHYIVQDWMGAIVEISDTYDVTYLRTARDFVTRKWYKFPVENRDDWEQMKPRYNPDTPGRLPDDFDDRARILKNCDYPVWVYVNGPFWQMREWCGLEPLCMLMLQDPDFVQEMADFWKDYILTLLERLLDKVVVDHVVISEDMAYKEKPMISADMTRRFCKPCWESWATVLKQAGCSVVEVDSDGRVDILLPVMIEAGINCCSPMEVAAGNDIVALRNQHGKAIAFRGGIDKRCMAKGGAILKNEINRVVPPLFKTGGFIPSCDHGVPPDISWQNYIEHTRLLAELSGWL